MQQQTFTITFWGVRGSIPVPGTTTLKYGGNTSCVEVRCGNKMIVLDAGTGIVKLGERLGHGDIDILLSHTHLDHIQGFPFFKPLYHPSSTVRIWAGHLQQKDSVKSVLSSLMQPPIFPLTLQDLKAKLTFTDFTAGESLSSSVFTNHHIHIHTLPLNHPDGATAYRIEYQGKSVCYVTDVEHIAGTIDAKLVAFLQGADLFIYDSTFSDAEYEHHKGWGHSTWEQALRLAEAACTKSVAIFHHHPEAGDAKLDQLSEILKTNSVNAFVAYEGLTITLS